MRLALDGEKVIVPVVWTKDKVNNKIGEYIKEASAEGFQMFGGFNFQHFDSSNSAFTDLSVQLVMKQAEEALDA